MTDATRLTPLGVMVLALLREDPMHPYEMIQLNVPAMFWVVDAGQAKDFDARVLGF